MPPKHSSDTGQCAPHASPILPFHDMFSISTLQRHHGRFHDVSDALSTMEEP